MYSTFITLIWTTLFYAVLAWYFDHVISSNRGVPERWWFPVSKKYWSGILSSITSKKEHSLMTSPLKAGEEEDEVDSKQTALYEKRMIEKDELLIERNKKSPFFDGVRAIGLSKSY